MEKRNWLGFIFTLGVMVLAIILGSGYTAFIEATSPDIEAEEIDIEDVDDLAWEDLGDVTVTGEGFGKNEEVPIRLEISISDGEITDIEILDHEETDGMSDPAFEEVPPSIIEEQSVEVDVASGATYTSEGIKQAVADAIISEID